mgnify:CR=1 FL=1
MKKIEIQSRYSRDKINKAQGKCVEQSKEVSYIDQIKLLNEAYLSENKCDIRREIKKKISGYKAQDKKDEERMIEGIISEEEVLEKLVASKLKCHYCSDDIFFLYDKVGEKKQWTLDRVDNTLGHFRNNIVISCLECNLQRKDMNKDKFKFTKNLKIVRSE